MCDIHQKQQDLGWQQEPLGRTACPKEREERKVSRKEETQLSDPEASRVKAERKPLPSQSETTRSTLGSNKGPWSFYKDWLHSHCPS